MCMLEKSDQLQYQPRVREHPLASNEYSRVASQNEYSFSLASTCEYSLLASGCSLTRGWYCMKTTTDDGKKCYDLWFILEGKGTSRGSVLRAKCMCKGGKTEGANI